VKPILQEGRDAIREILDQHQRPDRRLKAFLQHTDLLKALKEYQEKLRAFVEAGRPAEFRRARALARAVERARRVASELSGKEVQGWLDEMAAIEKHREIVERWASFYQNMQPLLKRYQAAYESQHRARHEAYAQVKAELDGLGIPTGSLSDRLCEGPVGWSLDGLTCTTCGTALETLYYQIQSAPQERSRLAAQHAPPPGESADAPKFEILRLYDVIKTRDISTAEDLEAAVSELRKAVRAALEAGKRVVLG